VGALTELAHRWFASAAACPHPRRLLRRRRPASCLHDLFEFRYVLVVARLGRQQLERRSMDVLASSPPENSPPRSGARSTIGARRSRSRGRRSPFQATIS